VDTAAALGRRLRRPSHMARVVSDIRAVARSHNLALGTPPGITRRGVPDVHAAVARSALEGGIATRRLLVDGGDSSDRHGHLSHARADSARAARMGHPR